MDSSGLASRYAIAFALDAGGLSGYENVMTQPPFSLRPLRVADADAVAALVRSAFAAQTVVTDPLPSALRESGGNIAQILSGGGGGVAADFAGVIGGALVWEEKDGGLYVGRVSVDQAYRGHGIARAMVGAAEGEARRRGLPRMGLSTRLALLDNRRLFGSLGFVEIAEHAHAGYDHPTYVDMEKWIS